MVGGARTPCARNLRIASRMIPSLAANQPTPVVTPMPLQSHERPQREPDVVPLRFRHPRLAPVHRRVLLQAAVVHLDVPAMMPSKRVVGWWSRSGIDRAEPSLPRRSRLRRPQFRQPRLIRPRPRQSVQRPQPTQFARVRPDHPMPVRVPADMHPPHPRIVSRPILSRRANPAGRYSFADNALSPP